MFEQIHASNYVGELCAANRPSPDETFYVRVDICILLWGILQLETLLDIRTSAVAYNIRIVDTWILLIFIVPVEELFAGREILPDIHISAKLFDLVPLVIISRGLPQGYCYHLRMGGYRLQVYIENEGTCIVHEH